MDDEAVKDCRSVTSPLNEARAVGHGDVGKPHITPLRGPPSRFVAVYGVYLPWGLGGFVPQSG